MISIGGIESVARDLWTFKQVRDIMVPIESLTCVQPADNVSEVLDKMVSENIKYMPVIENGTLEGIVARSDIVSLLKPK